MAPQGMADEGQFGVARERRSSGEDSSVVIDVAVREVDAKEVVTKRKRMMWT